MPRNRVSKGPKVGAYLVSLRKVRNPVWLKHTKGHMEGGENREPRGSVSQRNIGVTGF